MQFTFAPLWAMMAPMRWDLGPVTFHAVWPTHSAVILMESQFLQIGPCKIAYEIHGKGTPVLLMHGFGLDRRSMRPLSLQLSHRFRTILFDWRGHGETQSPEVDAAFSYPVLRDDLLRFMEELEIEKAHFVGHSMGAQIGLMAAIADPARVATLTTFGAGPCRPVTQQREIDAWNRSAAFFETAPPEKIAKALGVSEHVYDPESTAIDLSTCFSGDRGPDLARMIRGAFLNVQSNDEECAALATPALVIVGEGDEDWISASRKLDRLLPNSRLEVIGGAGHLVHLERPAAVLELIEEHLKSA